MVISLNYNGIYTKRVPNATFSNFYCDTVLFKREKQKAEASKQQASKRLKKQASN